jgi:hypothetical protein
MGLKERRSSKEFQDNRYPALYSQIKKEADFDISVEVNWETLEVDGFAHMYDECWPKVYFHPLVQAFKKLCDDDMSKEAVKESVKKVLIQNYSDNYSANRWATFKSGVLTLNHSPVTNVDNIEDRVHYLLEVVEKEL